MSDPSDPLERVAAALRECDAVALREALANPTLKGKLNDPLPGGAFGSTPLLCAVQIGKRELVDVLLDAGADINARSHWWAGSFGVLDHDSPLTSYLIQRGATVDPCAAARLGMLDRLEQLVRADPQAVHARGGDGKTPLHFASTIDVARFLLDHGADIDALDVDHESTPAQYLVRDRPDVARFLVSSGCRTDILLAAALGDAELVRRHLDQDPQSIRTSVWPKDFPMQDPRAGGHIYIWTLGANKTAHLVAREFGHEGVFQLLMSRTPDDLKLALACELGEEGPFRALLASKPDLVRSMPDDVRRKLVDAAQNNNIKAVRLMLEAGWPLDARGQHGGTALHWAAWLGNADIVRLLLRHGPPIEDASNDFGATPLGWAIHGSEHGWRRHAGDYPAVVQLLCDAGAKLPNQPAGTEAVKDVLRKKTGFDPH
jgi:ankyrin repeat protein